jgi:hypothetical protein
MSSDLKRCLLTARVSPDTLDSPMPRGEIRKRGDEAPDVPDELLGFPERIVLARKLARLQPKDTGTSRLERGLRVRKMAALTAVRIAERLGVRVGWLLRGEEPMYDPGRGPPRNGAAIVAEEVDE